MKTNNYYKLLLFIAILLTNSGCTEDPLSTSSPTYTAPPTNTTPTTQNIRLNVSAGEDIQVILSSDSRFLILSGHYFARGMQGEIINLNNVKIQWEKKSGPSGYTLENPNSIKTKVNDLEKGIYEFELTVTSDNGLAVKDIVKFIVSSISENQREIIFENKIWLKSMGDYIEINDFNLLVPQNNFKVYIQRENNPQWTEVKHYSEDLTVSYQYFIETRPDAAGMYTYSSLYISSYGSDTNDTPNIKIKY